MTEASFASLGPTLLARKGGAKPAMRPQVAALPGEIAKASGAHPDPLEDLGWNDMGGDEVADMAAEKARETQSAEAKAGVQTAKIVPISAKAGVDADRVSKRPTKTSAKSSAKQSAEPAPKQATKAKKSKAKKNAKRAAFTLRLDADRHLKLRLASTMHDMSAQALVTRALDLMLDEIEDLDALAQRMKRS